MRKIELIFTQVLKSTQNRILNSQIIGWTAGKSFSGLSSDKFIGASAQDSCGTVFFLNRKSDISISQQDEEISRVRKKLFQ